MEEQGALAGSGPTAQGAQVAISKLQATPWERIPALLGQALCSCSLW